MAKPIFLVLDTETGGLDPNCDSLLSISLVAWSRVKVGPALEVFVREPEIVTTADSMAINRIDVARLQAEGFAPDVAVERLERFVRRQLPAGQRATLAGHNVAFDIAFLKRLYRLARRDFSAVFSHRSFDTASVLLYLRLAGLTDLPDDSSDSAFTYFGVQPPSHARHSAKGDAIATAHLLTRLVDFGESLPPRRRVGKPVRKRPTS